MEFHFFSTDDARCYKDKENGGLNDKVISRYSNVIGSDEYERSLGG
jgi:hypothetical protein